MAGSKNTKIAVRKYNIKHNEICKKRSQCPLKLVDMIGYSVND